MHSVCTCSNIVNWGLDGLSLNALDLVDNLLNATSNLLVPQQA
jgi:hypothetical protein